MKKIMILAPHQDDELILCGGFLKELVAKSDVYIVFMTNGDYASDMRYIRLEEALKVCKLYGIKEEKIIFMGYANEYDKKGPHIYNAEEEEVVSSQYGNQETYGLQEHPEYCFRRWNEHHLYTRRNIKEDLKELIKEILPYVIFATDLEIHPDHKCNSLLLDEVLGEILRDDKTYKPIVLKKPGYMTSWLSINDYNAINNASAKLNHMTVRTNDHISVFDNPYMKWNERIRFPVGRLERNPNKRKNILYKALKIYKSQNAVAHYEMMQNSDIVFWQRRTDSILYRATVQVSSGNGNFLHDFKIVDSSSIKRRENDNWNADASIWRPNIDDRQKRIDFYLENEELISELYIYQEYYPLSRVTNSHILIDDVISIQTGELKINGITKIKIKPVKAKKVSFIIDDVSDKNNRPGISEIEVYKSSIPKLLFAKLMLKDNFVYDYYMKENEEIKLKVYEYWDDGNVKTVPLDEYDIEVESSNVRQKIFIQNDMIKGNVYSDVTIKVRNQKNKMIIDKIKILPSSQLKKGMKRRLLNDKSKSVIEKLVNDESGIYYGRCADKIASLSYGEYRENMGSYIKEFIRGYVCEDNKKEVHGSKKIFFIGTPDHRNIGDHAITIATYKVLKDFLPKYEIQEIPIQKFARKFPYLLANIREDDLIILQGGGNMGNVYWRNERIRREIISHFPHNKKIIFPETMYYEDTLDGKRDLEISKKIYNNDNLYILAREKRSYEIMKKSYGRCKIFLVPDIVCYMVPCELGKRSNDVGLCFRNDSERGIGTAEKKKITNVLEKENEKYTYLDMIYNSRGYIGKANRSRIVRNKIRDISSYKFIITDRLHGMILCYITGTPCIVISNYNHKIQSYYETWFKNVDYIRFVSNENDIEKEIAYVSKLKRHRVDPMNYSELKSILEGWK